MVSEGMLNWTIAPWLRRLLTRAISIVPSVIIAASVGKTGLNQALTASQVVLSVILPFVTAPLIWFTCRSSIMTVLPSTGHRVGDQGGEIGAGDGTGDGNGNGTGTGTGAGESAGPNQPVNMKNGWIVTIFAALIWLVLVVMNVSLLVLVGLGKA